MESHYAAIKDMPEHIRNAFPGYKGREVRLDQRETLRLSNYWSGGTRSYYRAVDLATGAATAPAAETENPLRSEAYVEVPLKPGVVLVELRVGAYAKLLIVHALPGDIAPMLPAPDEATHDEKIVLAATRTLKSSYAGISNYRFHEARRYTNITTERWEAAKAALIERKLLNKAGAITIAGRNAIGSVQLIDLSP